MTHWSGKKRRIQLWDQIEISEAVCNQLDLFGVKAGAVLGCAVSRLGCDGTLGKNLKGESRGDATNTSYFHSC